MARALFGDPSRIDELPALFELIPAAIQLAEGSRPKALLPLAAVTAEIALVRTRDGATVSLYDTGGAPEVYALDRPFELRALLDACAGAAAAWAAEGPSHHDAALLRLAERATRAQIVPLEDASLVHVLRRGGVETAPPRDIPLAFGFEARIRPSGAMIDGPARADVHAMLFEGSLWAFVRGRRLDIARGPVLLAAQRMVTAVRALLEAWDEGRTTNVRLRAGSFSVAVRLERNGEVAFTLGDGSETLTATALDAPSAAAPVLRLASDLLRALVTVDRAQARNLRVRALRDEVRTTQKLLRARAQQSAFLSEDPERLRSARGEEGVPSLVASAQPAGTLRFAERFRIELEELDASATFLCGDRIVVSSPRRTIAVCRDQGEALWVREGTGFHAFMAGTVLVRPSVNGQVELCDVTDGDPYAVARVTFRAGASPTGFFAGGDSIPPMVVLEESPHRLVAIDLRTGELRFRHVSKRAEPLYARRAGRALVVASRDGTIEAIDLASGEVVWRFAEPARFSAAPVVGREVVVAASSGGGNASRLLGIDLCTGRALYAIALDAPIAAPPLVCGDRVLVVTGRSRRALVHAFDVMTGAALWSVPDPGVSVGASWMTLDRTVIVNCPSGRIAALDLDTGETRWSRSLAPPHEADVPRKLEPIVRGGALFVPSAQIHVLRPASGAPHGAPIDCDLVPDFLRVDERGWVFVGEESGILAAYAPVPHLSLVRG